MSSEAENGASERRECNKKLGWRYTVHMLNAKGQEGGKKKKMEAPL